MGRMMDISDQATRQEELMRNLAILQALRQANQLQDIGECYWCNDRTAPGHRFCDVDCRDSYEKAKRMEKINGMVNT